MIKVIGITHDNELEADIPLESVDFSRYQWFWTDFDQPTDEELQHLAYTFKFHPLAIEDCIHRLQRPKLDYYDDHTFFVTHNVREEEMELVKEELDFFVGDSFIVTFHWSASKEVNQVWQRLLAHRNLEKWNPFYVFYEVLDKIVDNYFPLVYEIEESLAKIEDNTQQKSMDVLMTELFDSRSLLLSLRQTVNPMRDLLYRMLNSHHLNEIQDRREYFSDIYDHLLKLSEMVMSNRELTADIRDSYLSLNSHQTNNVMKVLTIITSIFAPLTFIAGIYGMNFEHMPELTWQYGYFLTLVVMVVLAVAMFGWFRRLGWFK
ncbi:MULTISPECIES: magnesium/cobalt transporter CorA [Planomicrobium]|uniref:magnesium/cobalt transporter CorA n=1 Tax=Planomicrobium TaxID=162291 RepID=UPI000C79B285|nr:MULTISPECIES: magnesium/cobalt transporter CorA [Planomicrobium]PKH10216.1 magnesium and cobalt transport protein CorA [Planomicrobium sp. MB-3u-38]